MTSIEPIHADEPPISDELRQRAVEYANRLYSEARVDLDSFQRAHDQLFRATTEADIAAVIRDLPSPVEMTPVSRRREAPFEMTSHMGAIRLTGRWQLSRVTKIESEMGSVIVDLSDAEFDSRDSELTVRSRMGSVVVRVPRGFDVRIDGQVSAFTTELEPPIPGYPIVRLTAVSDMGKVQIVHPAHPKRHRLWRRRRQGRPTLPR